MTFYTAVKYLFETKESGPAKVKITKVSLRGTVLTKAWIFIEKCSYNFILIISTGKLFILKILER